MWRKITVMVTAGVAGCFPAISWAGEGDTRANPEQVIQEVVRDPLQGKTGIPDVMVVQALAMKGPATAASPGAPESQKASPIADKQKSAPPPAEKKEEKPSKPKEATYEDWTRYLRLLAGLSGDMRKDIKLFGPLTPERIAYYKKEYQKMQEKFKPATPPKPDPRPDHTYRSRILNEIVVRNVQIYEDLISGLLDPKNAEPSNPAEKDLPREGQEIRKWCW